MSKRLRLGLLLSLLLAAPAAAVDEVSHVAQVLRALTETPGVSGYEERVSAWLVERLQSFKPQVDNLGNVVVTLGSGAPHRLLVTAIDEPGYVVSAITPEGYLRVQRLPQAGVNPWFDLLHSAQPVQILTREGKLVPGVVAGLSTHLQPGREFPVDRRTDHLDRIFIDVGAHSAEEVRALGVDVLDPITLEKHAYALGHNELTAPFLSDRVGAAALVRLVEGMDASRLAGTLTVAFVVRRYMGNQGLDRLLHQVAPDEVIFVGAREGSEAVPGAGLLIAAIKDKEASLAEELLAAASQHGLPAQALAPEPAASGRYSGVLALPERTAAVGIGVRFPQTPAEIVSADEVTRLEELLALYLGVTIGKAPPAGGRAALESAPAMPAVGGLLRNLIEVYGVSGYEAPVAEEVRKHLPPWAQEWAFEDDAGNLILALGRPSDKPSLVFIAHMDEIGWVVKEIRPDGRLVLDRRGGFLEEHFLGHVVIVHPAKPNLAPVPAVLELPDDYRSKKYELVRGREHIAYTGARSAEEVEQMGIRVGDSVTVPKKYRQLAGTRISARSFDDRVGSTALVAALEELDPAAIDRDVVFVWSVGEETGLDGARYFAQRAAGIPDFVFAIDTFVSADSPLESPRFAQARVGEGFVVRAVDSSNIVPRPWADRVVAIARSHNIPVQYGVTGGGNDGAVFVPYGSVDVALGWPLRYSHSAAEVADLADVEALAHIVAVLVKEF